MANKNWPHGFHPVNGDLGRIPVRPYTLETTNVLIGVGDLIVAQSDGTVDKAATGGSQKIVGVAAEPKAANAGGVAATAKISLWPVEGIIYEAQSDDATIAAQADIFSTYDFVDGAAVRGRSIMEINGGSGGTASTDPIKVIGVYPDPRNALGANVRLLCVINTPFLGDNTAGV